MRKDEGRDWIVPYPPNFTDAKGNSWSCRIVDMSENGFGITTGANLRIGNTLTIVRPCVEAKVCLGRRKQGGLKNYPISCVATTIKE